MRQQAGRTPIAGASFCNINSNPRNMTMSEGGHFNRAARRSGGDKNARLAIPAMSVAMFDALIGETQVRNLAKETCKSIKEVIQSGRDIGYIKCSDDDAKWLEEFLTEP